MMSSADIQAAVDAANQGGEAERTHALELLRQSEERFRLMVESVRDYAIFMLDPDGYISSWNRGAELAKGYQAGESIGKLGMRPAPSRVILEIASSGHFGPSLSSVGICGGAPARVSPWQLAQFWR